MSFMYAPSSTEKYRQDTADMAKPVIFSGTKVCRCCKKTRSVGQFKTAKSVVCLRCAGAGK